METRSHGYVVGGQHPGESQRYQQQGIYGSTGFRVSKDGNRGKKELGRVEGRVEHG